MSKSTHLILKKLVLNDFYLKVALWDKIQKSLFQEVLLCGDSCRIGEPNALPRVILMPTSLFQ